MVVRIPHKRTDKICDFYEQNLRIICYCVLGINWLQIIKIMKREEEISNLAIELYNLYAKNAVRFHDIVEMAVVWADAHQPSPWISVEDRLPEDINKFTSIPVLCRYTRGGKEYFHVSQYDFELNEWSISNVTHWMPIIPIK